jgi:uncharacterized protein (DUF2126 family)
VQLNWVIEPWHVLGEELSSTGTSQFVDSSLERLQVKFLELFQTVIYYYTKDVESVKHKGKRRYVAGIRYKA